MAGAFDPAGLLNDVLDDSFHGSVRLDPAHSGLFSRFDVDNGGVPRVRDMRLNSALTVSVRTMGAGIIQGSAGALYSKPFKGMEDELKSWVAIMSGSKLLIDNEKYLPFMWNPDRGETGAASWAIETRERGAVLGFRESKGLWLTKF